MSANGTVYLLHFEPGLRVAGNRYARHYIGWALDHEQRIAEHLRGQSSPLVRAVIAAGQCVELATVRHDVDRNFERRIKNRREASRFCPICVERGHSVRALDLAAVAA